MGFSPFEIVYDRPPPTIQRYIAGSTNLEALETSLTSRDDILRTLKTNWEKAQRQMKKNADGQRRDISFDIGDWVYIKLQPYRHTSVENRTHPKLSKRFYGPYKIINKYGQVAYELELSSSSKIHLVFHVSRLKGYTGDTTLPSNPLPPDATGNKPLLRPSAILNSKPTNLPTIRWF